MKQRHKQITSVPRPAATLDGWTVIPTGVQNIGGEEIQAGTS